MSYYTSNFLKFFLTFRANYDIIHNVKREAVSNQRNGKLMAPMGDCVETGSPFQLIPAESSPKGIKKVEKPLDKLKNLWYNKDVIKRGNLLNIKNRVATVAKMKGVYYDYS